MWRTRPRCRLLSNRTEALGGRIIHTGFMFGEYDTKLLVELPSEAAGVAAAFIGRSTGANEIKTLRVYDVESVAEAKNIAARVISSVSPSNPSK
ncbi:MAG: GYD domain-containing protein [Ilumatobacteraceae bacterium]